MHHPDDLATVHAALKYWQEEICPHGESAMRAYLEPPDARALSAQEVGEIRQSLLSNVRFAIYNFELECLDKMELFTEFGEAQLAAGRHSVATVITP